MEPSGFLTVNKHGNNGWYSLPNGCRSALKEYRPKTPHEDRRRQLLADRFQLTFLRDKRELSVYAIRVAKSGAKLNKNDSNPNGLPSFRAGLGILNLSNGTVAELASILQTGILDRPVLDETGFGAAKYDLMLKWTPDAAQSQPPGPNVALPADTRDAPPDLFAAFQQRLGLKLESTKALVNVLVIDRAEKPSEN